MAFKFKRRSFGGMARLIARVNESRQMDYEKSNATDVVPVRRLNSSYRTAILDAVRDTAANRQKLGQALVDYVCKAMGIPTVRVTVLEGCQPHATNDRGSLRNKKLGDYRHVGSEGLEIRVWNLTAVKRQRTTNKVFLGTLLHELCHHIDCAKLGIVSSPHTAGFYKRISHLHELMTARASA